MWGWAFALGLIVLAVLAAVAIADIAVRATLDTEADVEYVDMEEDD
jgi:hypothetical protein